MRAPSRRSRATLPPGPLRRPGRPGARLRSLVATRTGGLPTAFWWVWWGTLVNRLGLFVEPFLILYLTRERGLDTATAGGVVAALGMGALASQPLGGWLADRVGRRTTMVVGLAATAGVLLGLGAVRSPAALTALAFATGLTIDLYRPAVQAFVADVVPSADRPRAMGLLYWAVNLGFAGAGLLAGVIAELDYTWLFVADAATTLVFAALILWRVPESRPVVATSAPDPVRPGRATRDRLLLGMTGIAFLYACVYFQAFVTLPLAVTGAGLGPSAYGVAIATNGVVIILVQPLVVDRLARLPRTAVLAGSQIVVGLGFGLTAFASSIPGFVAVVAVWTLGEIAAATLAPTIVADIAPPALRGRYMGVFGVAFGAAAVVAPAAGTRLFAASPDLLWAACAVAGVVTGIGQAALGPALRRRSATLDATGPGRVD